MRFTVHFPEQTIVINSEDYDNRIHDKDDAEFFASSNVVADSVEVDL